MKNEFVRNFIDEIDENGYLPPIGTWAEGSYERAWARTITSFLVSKEIAIKSVGRYSARLIKPTELDGLLFPLCEQDVEQEVVDVSTEFSYIYLIRSKSGLVKIGKADNLHKRFNDLCNMSPIPLKLEYYFSVPSGKVFDIERFLHRLFAHKGHHGEWFSLSNKDIELVKTMDIRRRFLDGDDTFLLIHETKDNARKFIRNILQVTGYIALHVLLIWIISILFL